MSEPAKKKANAAKLRRRRPEAHEVIWSTLARQPFFGVYLLQDGRFVYVNQRFAEILGYTVDEVMRLPSVLDTVYEADREMVRENIRARLDGDVDRIRYSLRGRKKDGSPVELEVEGRRVMHEGRPAVVGVQSDVSERAREERTYHARQKAEALGELAVGVAHDFNNVLAVIGTTAELAATEASESVARDLADIREAVRRGALLCQRLMSFGSRGKSAEAAVSVADVLMGLSPLLERLLKRRRVRLNMLLPVDLPRVRLGSAELEQVVMNLTLNAGDATPEGGEVEVSAAVDHATDVPRMVLTVRDRGTGIAPEHLGRIFEPYFTTKGDEGNGLGLRNVWLIVSASGGVIEVDSELGRGSTFSVFLPVERRSATRG